MDKFLNISIFITGFGGIIAQVILLRELLINFCGNELTLGIILANWLISESLGALAIGKISRQVKDKFSLFICLQIIFCCAFFISIVLCRTFRNLLGFPFGEIISLQNVFLYSFAMIFPASFCHGGLFTLGCGISKKIGKIYAWETIGTIIGGLALTYFLLPFLNSFQIAFLVISLSLLTCLFFFSKAKSILLRIFLLFFIALFLLLGFKVNAINKVCIENVWLGQAVIDYENSVYGNVTVTKKENQFTFYHNGTPAVVVPYPDITFIEEFGNIPLLFSQSPQNVLIIGGGAGGLIHEFLKHPVKHLDYAELDPLLIRLLKKVPAVLTYDEFDNPRVRVINKDGRAFLKNYQGKYDVILVGSPKPTDLVSNRLFTKEFFYLTKGKLNNNGIFAFWLPGSLSYLSPDLKDLNASILNGVYAAFKYIRIIPGDYFNIILATDSFEVSQVSAKDIIAKFSKLKIETKIISVPYLNYRLEKKLELWLKDLLESGTKKINTDFAPFAIFKSIILWNRQFSEGFANFLVVFEKLNLAMISVVIFLLSVILILVNQKLKTKNKIGISYSILTTGFFGMLLSFVFIIAFQIIYGYLYYQIGLLISIFMAGIASGSIVIQSNLNKIKDSKRLFICFEIAIIIFTFISVYIINWISRGLPYSNIVFFCLFLLTGTLLGAEFPLASRICSKKNETSADIAGGLYFSDLIGGWIAGILGGVVLLPVLGLFKACFVIVIFKLGSLFVLIWQEFTLSKN